MAARSQHGGYVSQTEQRRIAVEGRRDGNGACTVLAIRERGGWVLYPHGAVGMAVRLTDADAVTLGTGLLSESGSASGEPAVR